MKVSRTSIKLVGTTPSLLLLGLLLIQTAHAGLILGSNALNLNGEKVLKVINRKLGSKEIIDVLKTNIASRVSEIAALQTACKPANAPPVDKSSPAVKSSDITGVICPLLIDGKTLSLLIRYMALNDKSGELFISSATNEAIPDPFEFSLKFTIKTIVAGGKPDIDGESLSNIAQQLTEKLKAIKEGLTALALREVQEKIHAIIKPHYDFVPSGSTEDGFKCLANSCHLSIQAKPKKAIEGIEQTKFEVSIQILPTDPSFALVHLQLGMRHFSLKIPITGLATNWVKIEADLNTNMTTWFEASDKENIAVGISDAFTKIKTHLSNQELPLAKCYNEITPPAYTGSDNFFTMAMSIKADSEASPECKSEAKVRVVSNFVNVFYLSYQYGMFNYGHLFLDSQVQSSEYLIDLNLPNFEASIESEIKSFVEGLSIVYGSEEKTEELSFDSIGKFIQDHITGVACAAPTGNSAKCLKGDQPIATITLVKGETDMFRIKFIYPKRAAPKTEKVSGTLTNTIVLQKFNSYNQFKRIEAAVVKFPKDINL